MSIILNMAAVRCKIVQKDARFFADVSPYAAKGSDRPAENSVSAGPYGTPFAGITSVNIRREPTPGEPRRWEDRYSQMLGGGARAKTALCVSGQAWRESAWGPISGSVLRDSVGSRGTHVTQSQSRQAVTSGHGTLGTEEPGSPSGVRTRTPLLFLRSRPPQVDRSAAARYGELWRGRRRPAPPGV